MEDYQSGTLQGEIVHDRLEKVYTVLSDAEAILEEAQARVSLTGTRMDDKNNTQNVIAYRTALMKLRTAEHSVEVQKGRVKNILKELGE